MKHASADTIAALRALMAATDPSAKDDVRALAAASWRDGWRSATEAHEDTVEVVASAIVNSLAEAGALVPDPAKIEAATAVVTQRLSEWKAVPG